MENKDYKLILERLLDIMDEGVYIVNESGVGIFYNRAMASIEQINVDDVIGKEYHKAFPGVKQADSTMFQALKKGLSTKNKRQSYKNLYGRNVTTVNSTIPVKLGNKTVAAIEVAKDITTLQSLSNTILELQEKDMVNKPAVPSIKKYSFDDLAGESPKFIEVIERAKKAAQNDATVFIYGETGTGKELFAQSIHYASKRKNKPFLAQNCAALPESLLEGILFGTTKGGFTGATDRAGLFEQASGGTLLLDEINSMPFELQGKLLRVLQERYIRRVGGTRDIPIDTRIIATVNESPQKLIEEGKLRRDLYYRLNVVGISIPPLRERMSDIPLLVELFLKRYNKQFEKNLTNIEKKAIEKLNSYDYPGNVRELENIIVQAVSMADEESELTGKLLQMPMRAEVIGDDIARWQRRGPLTEYMDSLEKEIIRETLLDKGGNISKTADALMIKRQTLQHKMKKYGLKE
ncbi:MAG: sigma 54-interacting transcriptional regulator [Eubacterium sp.]|nr:sigma 54-interacting transcriptional regulator [Eubacterium sp.]